MLHCVIQYCYFVDECYLPVLNDVTLALCHLVLLCADFCAMAMFLYKNSTTNKCFIYFYCCYSYI